MREQQLITIRVGYAGRNFGIRLGRTAVISVAVAAAAVFVLLTQGIYDIRDNLSKLRELRSLRERVSEQELALHGLHAKFEGLVAEVDRLRSMDNRLKSLDINNNPVGAGRRSGIGGGETPEASAAGRIDLILDREFDRLKKDVLVQVTNLDLLGERLEARRTFLESLPKGWPVRGVLSSTFGVRNSPFTGTPVFHHGLDIVTGLGTAVSATGPGTVVKSAFEALMGNVIEVDHGAGYRTVYAHLSSRSVGEGASVSRGDELGKVGATGRATGPHLHYEVRVDGLRVNPARFLN
ncbi:MAG: M23 family metallopeptidase [Thermodesulfobacteriota bacterium]